MASNELGITFTGDISDITAKVEELTTLLSNLSDQVIDITINADTAAVAELSNELDTLSPAADNVANEMDKVSNETQDASNSMGQMSTNAGSAGDALSGATGIISQFSGQAGSAASSAKSFTDSLTSMLGISGEVAAELTIIGTVIAALTGAMYMVADAAGDFNDSWLRLSNAVGEGGTAIQDVKDEWSDAINTMKDETGRSAGIIREHIITMGLAGVESKDLIIEGFSGISGAAFVTGQSIDSIEQAYRRVVSTGMLGSRQLMAFGLTTDDVFKATGMTLDEVREKFKNLDEDGRAALMNQILNMKYGADANEAYKMSWQHVQDAIQAAFAGLTIVIGQLVIPLVIPALNALTTVLGLVSQGITFTTNALKFLGIDLTNVSGWIKLVLLTINPLMIILFPFADAIGYVSAHWAEFAKWLGDVYSLLKAGDWAGAFALIAAGAQNAINLIVGYFAQLPARIGELSGMFLDIGVKIVDWIVQGLDSVIDWLDNALAENFYGAGEAGAEGTVDGFGKWMDDNWPKVEHIIITLVTQILPKVLEAFGKAGALLGQQLMDKMGTELSQLPGKMYNWAMNAMQSFAWGIVDSIPGVSWALNEVKKHFPSSPPEIGPLSEVKEENVYSWVSGLLSGGVGGAVSDLTLGNTAIPTGNLGGSSINNVRSGDINVEVHMGGVTVSGDADVDNLGSTVASKTASKLASQATNSGISVVNYMR